MARKMEIQMNLEKRNGRPATANIWGAKAVEMNRELNEQYETCRLFPNLGFMAKHHTTASTPTLLKPQTPKRVIIKTRYVTKPPPWSLAKTPKSASQDRDTSPHRSMSDMLKIRGSKRRLPSIAKSSKKKPKKKSKKELEEELMSRWREKYESKIVKNHDPGYQKILEK